MDEETAAALLPTAKVEWEICQAHVRRSSTGKMGISCNRQPVASRYLLASMGSCHDLCKRSAEKRHMDSMSRKKPNGLVNDGGVVSCEITGNGKDRESRTALVKLKNGREKGSSPISASDRCNGCANIALTRGNSMGLVLNAGKAQSDVPNVGASSDDFNVPEGEGLKETWVHPSDLNLADVDDSGDGNLTRAPSLLSMSSPESKLVREKTGTEFQKGPALDNEVSSDKKLSFRQGTSSERHSDDHSPHRLRFRRPMFLESQIGSRNAGGKDFRKVEAGVAGMKSRKQERVVLRHRAVEKRQDSRSLFNNMIEETASKLIKVRKSKVKALVGAFETVISLQDNKKLQAMAAVC